MPKPHTQTVARLLREYAAADRVARLQPVSGQGLLSRGG